MDRFDGQAFDVILKGVARGVRSVEGKSEDAGPLLDTLRAGTSVTRSTRSGSNNHKMYADHSRTLGKLLLLARRLCEAGVGFVTVNTNVSFIVWDMHADQNNASMEEGMRASTSVCRLRPRGVGVHRRRGGARPGRSCILLVCCGEIGRTPRVNKAGGRDHWGNLGPLFFSGGGLPHGTGGRQFDEGRRRAGVGPGAHPNVIATILNTLLDVGEVRLMRGISGDVARVVTQGEPIAR